MTPAPRVADSQPPKSSSFAAVEAGQGGDGFGEDGGGGVRVGKAADGAVDGDQFEGDLLRDGHHDLLQLGLGAERDQPELAAGIFGGEIRGFIERAGGPGVEDRGQDHFVFEAGAGRGGDGFQSLQRVGNDARANDDVQVHLPFYFSFFSSAFGLQYPQPTFIFVSLIGTD